MAFSTTLQPIEKEINHPVNTPSTDISDAVLSMMLLSVYGANMSKKTVRRLKRKFFFTSLKLKVKALFKPRLDANDRTLLYIILGAALVALLIIDAVLVLALAAVVLILYLAGVL